MISQVGGFERRWNRCLLTGGEGGGGRENHHPIQGFPKGKEEVAVSQSTEERRRMRRTKLGKGAWGGCTVLYAVRVASKGGHPCVRACACMLCNEKHPHRGQPPFCVIFWTLCGYTASLSSSCVSPLFNPQEPDTVNPSRAERYLVGGDGAGMYYTPGASFNPVHTPPVFFMLLDDTFPLDLLGQIAGRAPFRAIKEIPSDTERNTEKALVGELDETHIGQRSSNFCGIMIKKEKRKKEKNTSPVHQSLDSIHPFIL